MKNITIRIESKENECSFSIDLSETTYKDIKHVLLNKIHDVIVKMLKS